MTITQWGTWNRKGIVAVGSWNPVTSYHRALVAQMRDAAKSKDACVVLAMITPDVLQLMRGPMASPDFEDPKIRIERLLDAGADMVVQTDFAATDLGEGGPDYLTRLSAVGDVSELWLGGRQTLGRSTEGSRAAIASAAAQRGVHVRVLPKSRSRAHAGRISAAVEAGRLSEVRSALGHGLAWSRPNDGVLTLTWPAGRYVALEPTVSQTSEHLLSLVRTPDGRSKTEWPVGAGSVLEFVRGPGDVPSASPSWL